MKIYIKKALICLWCIIMMSSFSSISNAVFEKENTSIEFYVSVLGDDSNNGSAKSPFKTIERAKAEVKKHSHTANSDIVVNVLYGTYYLDEPLTFTTEDSGKNGNRIIYKGIADENGNLPVVSGGIDLTDGWKLYDPCKNIYRLKGVTWEFRQLYIDSTRAVRARYPNLEDEETGGPYLRATGGDGTYPLFIGKYNCKAAFMGKNAEVVWNSSWSQFRARIDSYNPFNGKVTFKSPDNSFAWNHHTQGDTPYYLENSLSFLDAEGEWYLDTDRDILYYKPRSGEVMNQTQIIAPYLETILDFKGNSENEKVENITIDGIKFLHTNWIAPSSYGYCSVQGGFRYQTVGGKDNSAIRGSARYETPTAMVQLRNTCSIELINSEFSFSGSWGIVGYENTEHTLIDHNVFTQNARGGITMGMAGNEWDDMNEDETIRSYTDMDGQSIHDTITNNLVYKVALDYRDMVGIGSMLPQYMTIANNEIGTLPYSGINIGWNWQDTDHGMTCNKVYQNYIHDICMLLQDGAGIYTLGKMNGDSAFYYNYITNIEMSEWAPHDNLMGIYFDNGSCYKMAKSNVMDNTVYAFQAFNPPNYDNIFDSNYYNCPKGISSTGSSVCTNNTSFSSDNVPDEAQFIINHAGIDKEILPDPTIDKTTPAYCEVISSGNNVYDKNPLWKTEIKFSITQKGCRLSYITNEKYTLISDVDYEIHWDTVIIKESYLNTLKGGTYSLEFQFDNGDTKQAGISVLENDETKNIALGKPVTASSESISISNINDGKTETRWAQAEGTPDVPSVIILDLQYEYNVTKSFINFELQSAGYNYKIEYSLDGVNWFVFVDKTSEKTITQKVVDDGMFTARYLKLTVNHTQWGASIWEWQIKGTSDSDGISNDLTEKDETLPNKQPSNENELKKDYSLKEYLKYILTSITKFLEKLFK